MVSKDRSWVRWVGYRSDLEEPEEELTDDLTGRVRAAVGKEEPESVEAPVEAIAA